MQAGSHQHHQHAPVLTIKNLTIPAIPEDFESINWPHLHQALDAIFNDQKSAEPYEVTYSRVHDYCLAKHGSSLFKNLLTVFDEHIQTIRNRIDGLESVVCSWKKFQRDLVMVKNLFTYLDRTYVASSKNHVNEQSLFAIGIKKFAGIVFLDPKYSILEDTVEAVLTLIALERKNEFERGVFGFDEMKVERDEEAVRRKESIHDVLSMFVDLNLYQEHLETLIVVKTREYYAAESSTLLASKFDISKYLAHCDRRYDEEIARVQAYLLPSTQPPLITAFKEEMIGRNVATLVGDGLVKLLDSDSGADLERLFHLLYRVGSLGSLRQRFGDYIVMRGTDIIEKQGAPPPHEVYGTAGSQISGKASSDHPTAAMMRQDVDMVDDLLHFKSRMDSVLIDAFSSEETFSKTLKDSFETFINSRPNKPVELIAKWIDRQLRSKSQSKLQEVLVLFRFIHGKDLFEAFYKKDLAKRLLLDRSASVDAEKTMISKLKEECGPAFTSKLEGMLRDMEASKEMMYAFRQSQRIQQSIPMTLNVSVLTLAFWPPYPKVQVTLPEAFKTAQQHFTDFYLSKYQGRRLTWQPTLGSCHLRATLPKANHDLIVSLSQALVLLLFNYHDLLTMDDIQRLTGIQDDKELDRTVLSMTTANQRLLLQSHKSENRKKNQYQVNTDFTHHLVRLKLNQIQLRETPEETFQTTQSVFQDRQYQVDAAIVRILKSQKTITHNDLLMELFQLCKFPATSQDYKKRIESLIDRDYMERDAESPDLYRYLA